MRTGNIRRRRKIVGSAPSASRADSGGMGQEAGPRCRPYKLAGTPLQRYYEPIRLPSGHLRGYGFPRGCCAQGTCRKGLSVPKCHLSARAVPSNPGKSSGCFPVFTTDVGFSKSGRLATSTSVTRPKWVQAFRFTARTFAGRLLHLTDYSASTTGQLHG